MADTQKTEIPLLVNGIYQDEPKAKYVVCTALQQEPESQAQTKGQSGSFDQPQESTSSNHQSQPPRSS